jgi:hypothetical protein
MPILSRATGVELPGTVPAGSTSPGGPCVPVRVGTAGMASAVPGTTSAGEAFEAAALLRSSAGEARAMPPLINATAGMVAQALRQGNVIVRA